MSHIQQHKDAYQAFLDGDFEKVMDLFADDAVLHGGSPGMKAGEEFKGKEAIATGWLPALGEMYEEIAIDPAKFVEDGDWVAVLGHVTGKVAGTSIAADFAHFWRWEEGSIAEAWIFGDTAQLAAAMG